jgi:hypothetical protein
MRRPLISSTKRERTPEGSGMAGRVVAALMDCVHSWTVSPHGEEARLRRLEP